MVHELRSRPDGRGRRIAIAVAEFNAEVTSALLRGALDALRQHHVADADITVVHVPGAFELPLCCRWLAQSGRHDGVIALGAVIRGGTDHYEYVCRAATEGVLRVNLDTGLPVTFGVLTCATDEQAMARAGGSEGNKGADVAVALLAMLALQQELGKAPGPHGSAGAGPRRG